MAMPHPAVTLHPGRLTLGALRRIHDGAPVALAPGWRARVQAGEKAIADIVAAGLTVYGVNTGFGKLAQSAIPAGQLAQLQRNLILSHSTGVGALLPDAVVRLVLALKVNALARGFSGVRPQVIEALAALLDAGALPCIPGQGSVGASGDLAPLAHLSAALMGMGRVRLGGETLDAAAALARCGMAPLEFGPKEGLALINGTQVSTALALAGLFAAEHVFGAAVVAGALSVDAFKGSTTPFDPRIQAIRGHDGQIAAAATYLALLEGSAIRHSHLACERVQDPYSLRCQPQVMGACLDQIGHVARVLAIEANAVSDNPLVFADTGEVLSGGNFHAEPVALASDALATAVAEIGSLSERRIAALVDASISGLPAFLVKESGVNSGFMIAHVTAAALASENKSLAHPASVDSLPTSANQEDHVSMATFAARRLSPMADNVAAIVAIELLAAAQGIEFHRPLKSSAALEAVMAQVRALVRPWEEDRYFAADIEAVLPLVREGRLAALPTALLPSFAGEPG